MTTTERERVMERMRIDIPEGNDDPLRQILSKAVDALVDYSVAEIISHGDIYSTTTKSLMEFKSDEDGFHAEKSLCRIVLLTTHAYYMFGIIYDHLRIRNEDLLDVRQRLIRFAKTASDLYFYGYYREFNLASIIAGHNYSFESYINGALKEKGMEDDITIELSTYIVSYSSIVKNLVEEYDHYLCILGYKLARVGGRS